MHSGSERVGLKNIKKIISPLVQHLYMDGEGLQPPPLTTNATHHG